MPPTQPPDAMHGTLRRLLHEALLLHRRHLAALLRMQREAGRKVPERPPGLDRITPTEQRVIERVATTDDKLSTVWGELGMSKRTFETHLASIYTKLGVHRRSGLVRVAVLWGLV